MFHEKKDIKISVAMCTYNGEKHIAEQLESILQQSLPVNEIIICDDASTDNTIQIIQKYKNKTSVEFKIVINPRNIGVANNFNQAISLCSGDIIFISDQDDVWRFRKVELMTRYLKRHPQKKLVLSNADFIQYDNKDIPFKDYFDFVFPRFFRQCVSHGLSFELSLAQCFSFGCTIAIHKDLSNYVHCLPPNFPSNLLHDVRLQYVAALNDSIGYINKHLMSYRLHPDSANQMTELLQSRGNSIYEIWPIESIKQVIREEPFKTRAAYMYERNLNIHSLLRIHRIITNVPFYYVVYKKNWLKVLFFDIRIIIEYKIIRLFIR